MAGFSNGAITSGPQFPTIGPGQSASQSSSSTSFSDPALVKQIADQIAGVGGAAAGQYTDFISNPTASPLFQNQLKGLLSSLAPGEAKSRLNLGDEFRNAGNMSSGIYGNAAANLEGDILRNRQTTASQLLGQMFPQMTQALQQPMTLMEQLASALKLSNSQSASNSQQYAPRTGSTSSMDSSGGTDPTMAGLMSLLGGRSAPSPSGYSGGGAGSWWDPTPSGGSSGANWLTGDPGPENTYQGNTLPSYYPSGDTGGVDLLNSNAGV